MAYIMDNKLIISGDGSGEIKLNPDSSNAFDSFTTLSSITGTEILNSSKVINMENMFKNCSSLSKLNLKSFNTSKVQNMNNMFLGCIRLKEINLGNKFSFLTGGYLPVQSSTYITGADGKWWDISTAIGYNYEAVPNNVDTTYVAVKPAPVLKRSHTWTSGRTYISSITSVEIKDKYTPSGSVDESWDASVAQDGGIMVYRIGTKYIISGNGKGKIVANKDSSDFLGYGGDYFSNYNSLTTITGLNILDTSQVTNMSYMFAFCSSLTSIDISSFDTSNVINMSGMFEFCSKLININLKGIDTSNVKYMDYMFRENLALVNVDLSGLDTRNLVSMSRMFDYSIKLKNVSFGGWETPNLINVEGALCWCYELETVDFGNIDNSKVTKKVAFMQDTDKLRQVKIGAKFNPNGFINFPSTSYAGSDGKWYNTVTKVGYECGKLPVNTAATYTAIKP